MGVYAHPDDESTCAGGVLAQQADLGVRVIVVTCTNGEFGDGPDGAKPGQDGHDPERVAATRRAELDAACRRLGVTAVQRLGYHDSGMPGWDSYARTTVFSQVPVDDVAARIAELLAKYRPQVVLTHNPNTTRTHVDHRHAARATELAVERTGIPDALYFSAHGGRHWQRLRDALREAGIELPAPDLAPLGQIDDQITTRMDISDVVVTRKRAALFEHVSQLGSSLAAKLTPEQYAETFRGEDFIRVRGTDDELFAR